MHDQTTKNGLNALRARFKTPAYQGADDIPQRNQQDESGLSPTLPLALIRPDSVEGFCQAVQICAEHGISIVPQGGMTGLVGGAAPLPQCIALSTERFSGIEEINTDEATMTVRAGTILESAQIAAEKAGLFLPLDLGARGSCTIGGVLATNAGGNRVIRYGMARELALGLEAVLSDGSLISDLSGMLKNNSGYNLKHIFIGAEGTLGVITRAVLRLRAAPVTTQAALIGLPDYDGVLRLLAGARRSLGGTLSAFEVMWPSYWNAVSQKANPPLGINHGFYILCETQGENPQQAAAAFEAFLGNHFDDGTISDAVIAQTLSEAKKFWAVRDATGDLHQIVGPYIGFDIGLPIKTMDVFVQRCSSALKKCGLDAVFYGHIADGNIHINVFDPSGNALDRDAINTLVYGLMVMFGGIVSAEHGIGQTKKPYLSLCRQPAEIAAMQRLKTAFDPNCTFNPGRIFDDHVA